MIRIFPMSEQNTTWIVTTINDAVQGFVSVHERPKCYFIDNFYVIPSKRGKGIGGAMIDEIVYRFTDKPLKCVACNPVAIHIFKYQGFVEDGHNGKYTRLVKH